MKKTKAQLDSEFIEKIKSLGFITGAKPSDDKCPDCGSPMNDVEVVGVVVQHRRKRHTKPDDSVSLSE